MSKSVLFVLGFALSLPSSAPAFSARNNLKVAAVDRAVFEVVGRPGSGAREFWCAAGDYLIRSGTASNTRLYLVRGRGPSVSQPGKKAVQFTTDPAAAGVTPTEPGLVLNVSQVGDNLSAAAAHEYCFASISKSLR